MQDVESKYSEADNHRFLSDPSKTKQNTEYAIKDILNRPLIYKTIEGNSSELYEIIRKIMNPAPTNKRKKVRKNKRGVVKSHKIKNKKINIESVSEEHEDLLGLITKIGALREIFVEDVQIELPRPGLYAKNRLLSTKELTKVYSDQPEWGVVNASIGEKVVIIFKKQDESKPVKMIMINKLMMGGVQRSNACKVKILEMENLCGLSYSVDTASAIRFDNIMDPILRISVVSRTEKGLKSFTNSVKDSYSSAEAYDSILSQMRGGTSEDSQLRELKTYTCEDSIDLYVDEVTVNDEDEDI